MTDDRTEMKIARDAGLVKRHEQRLARVRKGIEFPADGVERTAYLEGEPVHLRMGLTADGQGPADPPDPRFDHWGCWCPDAECPGPPEPVTHPPIGVRSTDVGVFVCCSCGKNPTPKLWLETHWAGEREEGKQLVWELISAQVDQEARP